MIKHTAGEFRWKDVDLLPYKEDGGTHFKSISRQTLFNGGDDLPVEFRYFEMAADGYSTLERHQHQHAVMIIRGSGKVFVGDCVTDINTHDVVHIPAMTWHQFRAVNNEPMGFLCVVACDRDKPQRPDAEQAAELTSISGEFVRY